MEVLIILVPLSLLILATALWILFQMIGTGQLDEGEGAAWRILADNDNTQGMQLTPDSDEHKEPE